MTLLAIDDLHVRYRSPRGVVHAVRGVDLAVAAGRSVALVGESGSGKTTVARAAVGLVAPTSGSVTFRGGPLTRRPGPGGVAMIFQDPIGSLHPHRRLLDVVAEPLRLAGVPRGRRRERAAAAMAEVGLDPAEFGDRLPTRISGGQAQRVAIARAVVAEPALIIADEPVASLDVSVQAGIVNLLHRLTERGTALLFISHDLGVVRTLCDDVVVLYLGRVCEAGPVESVLGAPQHPYTRALLAAVPEPGRPLAPSVLLDAEPPSPLAPPTGCALRMRCPDAHAVCAAAAPPLRDRGATRLACHSSPG